MGEPEIRAALDLHWSASANGNLEAEHDIYDDNVLCEYPQSGERILGRSNLQALRSHHPGKPSGFNTCRRRLADLLFSAAGRRRHRFVIRQQTIEWTGPSQIRGTTEATKNFTISCE